jgi:hypothetical protein
MSLKNTKVKVGKPKSKYKAPKDMEKSLKIPKRKEDYTHDDKDGGMNPYSTKEIQDLVPRKTDKLVIDDVENMVPEIKHRVYQDLENGKLNFKEAKKIFKKLQIEDTEGYLDKLEDIDHGVTTKPLDEQQIRSYVRNKIISLISEQGQEQQDQAQVQQDQAQGQQAQGQQETPDAESKEPPTEETPTEETPKKDKDTVINDFVDFLNNQVGIVGKLKIIFKMMRIATKDADPKDKKNLYRLLSKTANLKFHEPIKDESSEE